MILSKEIKIKISSPTINYYKNLGYKVMVGEFITIPINDLNKNSNIKIDIECDFCEIKKSVQYIAYNKYLNKSPDNKYRCNKCNTTLRKNTCEKKYGVSHYSKTKDFSKKYKKTIQDRYGVDHFNKLDFFKEKIQNTNFKRYGVKMPMQNIEIKEKQEKVIQDKFGYSCALQNKEVLEKSFNTMINKYGFKYSMQIPSLKNEIVKNGSISKINKILNENKNIIEIDYDNNLYIANCDICEKLYNITPHMFSMRNKQNTIICTNCNKVDYHTSGKEIILLSMIKKIYNGEIIINSRNIIPPYELDIFVPSLNIAFEFNGLYWHSNLYKEKNYHQMKSNLCKEKNIQLIHIWEDDIVYKFDIIKSMISNKLKKIENRIFARKCYIREILDNKLVSDFLNQNHLQGFVGSSIKIGLFLCDELVSIMTFGKKRKIMNSKSIGNEYELLRFCNKINTNVIGSASRLFKYFLNNYNPKEIVTYADISHSNGHLYEKLGFYFISKTSPNYYYIIENVRKHRFGFRKDKLVKDGYDPNKSESEIMLERGINKIYNAGNLKYKFMYIK